MSNRKIEQFKTRLMKERERRSRKLLAIFTIYIAVCSTIISQLIFTNIHRLAQIPMSRVDTLISILILVFAVGMIIPCTKCTLTLYLQMKILKVERQLIVLSTEDEFLTDFGKELNLDNDSVND